jgi:hypothetical protein
MDLGSSQPLTDMARKADNLDVSQLNESPWPATGIALPVTYTTEFQHGLDTGKRTVKRKVLSRLVLR